MKKIGIAVTALMVVLLFCLTGCNTNFKFQDLGLSKEVITEISVSYDKDKKVTSNETKIERIINELNSLDIEKFSDKVTDNVFIDDVVGEINMQIKDEEGSFTMIVVETIINGESVGLIKCDTTEGLKIKKLKKGIYIMESATAAKTLVNKLFANCI